MHVGVRADYSQFADQIRTVRGEVHEAIKQLADSWLEKKATFEDILESEFSAIGPTKKQALAKWFEEVLNPDPKDPLALVESSDRPIYREYRELCRQLEDCGVDEDQQLIQIMKLWHWDQQREIPHQRISLYLFAAVARRVEMGEKKIVDRELMNDVRTILDLSRFCAAPSARICHFPFESDMAFPAQC